MKELYLERIRGLREDRDLKQREIAKILHIAQRTYSGYENGSRALPVHILIDLAKYYDESLDWICGLSDKRKREQD